MTKRGSAVNGCSPVLILLSCASLTVFAGVNGVWRSVPPDAMVGDGLTRRSMPTCTCSMANAWVQEYLGKERLNFLYLL